METGGAGISPLIGGDTPDVPGVRNVLMDEKARGVEFSCLEEAKSQFIRLLDALGIDLLAGTRKAIPYAIEHGWRFPTTFQRLVKEALARKQV